MLEDRKHQRDCSSLFTLKWPGPELSSSLVLRS